MSFDALKSALPEYAADLRRNLTVLAERSALTPQQLWGTVLVCAFASRSARVLREVAPEARAVLSPEGYALARSTASIMVMNNVFFRTRHLLSDPAYGTLRTGLRSSPPRGGTGVDPLDVELWSFAVSAIGACADCLDAHEAPLRAGGVPRETVQEAFRIAAVIHAVATTLEAEAALADATDH